MPETSISCKNCALSTLNGAPDVSTNAPCYDCRRLSNFRGISSRLPRPDDHTVKYCLECVFFTTPQENFPCSECWNVDKIGWDYWVEDPDATKVKDGGPELECQCGPCSCHQEPEEDFSKPIENNPGEHGQYTWRGGIEPLEFIESNHMDFLEGSVIKYLYRYPMKGGLEALKKARFYINRLIEDYEEDEE